MSTVTTLVLLAVLVNVAHSSLECFAGEVTPPSQTKTCAADTIFCKKGAHGSGPDGTAIFAYDCDDTGNCQQDGCFSGPGGYTTCCCGSNQCNSSPMLASFIGITSVVFAKLLLLRS
ncbi:hypothetical protein Q1695_006936 [Nippostrongylus brasiliensis]|nr:hypothetical protein Q1695_006936 [Nippostrongylus brasiliensis]